MRPSRLNHYQETKLTTATPAVLARMALEECVRSARRAIEFQRQSAVLERGRAISKAMNLLNEFSAVLNEEANPELVANLRRIAAFAHERLFQAHVEQSESRIEEAIAVIEPVAEAWATVERRQYQPGNTLPA
jgi:flagellar biosynthetic protein FliS